MEQLKAVMKSAGALLALGIIVVGVPAALVTAVGWPLPRTRPAWDDVSWHLTNGQVPDEFWIKAIALLVWLVWFQLAWAIVFELLAALRDRTSRRPVLVLPGFHGLAVKLVGAAMLISTVASSTSQPVEAVSLSSLPSIGEESITTSGFVAFELEGHALERAGTAAKADSDLPTHVVESRRESMWALAEAYLGDGGRWEEIRDLNVGRRMGDGTVLTADQMRLRTGWMLLLPPDAAATDGDGDGALVDTEPDRFGDGVYTVESGDHFWAMAEGHLAEAWGRTPSDAEVAPYWQEVVEANRGRLPAPGDPDLIHPDEVYAMPAAPSDPLVSPGREGRTGDDEGGVGEPFALDLSDLGSGEPTLGGADAGGSNASEASPAAPPLTPSPDRPGRGAPATGSTEGSPAANPKGVPVTDGGVDPLRLLGGALTIGGGSVLAGTMLWRLRRQREWQLRRRRPGDPVREPSATAVDGERELRSIADHQAIDWLDAANRLLAASSSEAGVPPPPVVCARAGAFGVELLMVEPTETPLPGFVADDGGRLWRVDPKLALAEIQIRVDGAIPAAPALVAVGSTSDGGLLVDVERIGTLSVDGPPAVAMDFLTAVAAGLTSAPWSDGVQVDVVTLDPDPSIIALGARVVDPGDRSQIDRLLAGARAMSERFVGSSAHGVRCRPGAVDLLPPTIVLVGRDHPMLATELAAVAAIAGSGLGVVAACPVPGADHHIELFDERQARLEPAGIDFELVTMSPAMVAATVELYEASRRLPAAAIEHALPVESDASVGLVVDRDDAADDAASSEPPDVAGDGGRDGDGRDARAEAADEYEGADGHRTGVEPDAVTAARGDAEVDRLSRRPPVDICILGPPIVVGDDIEVGGRSVEILAFLAANVDNRVDGERIADAVYGGDISPGGLRNAITKTRKSLGTDVDGKPRLEAGSRWSGFSLGPEIGCDWWRFRALVAAVANLDGDAALRAHTAALQLVRGQPFAGAPKDRYGWVTEDRQLLSQIEVAVTDAAAELGRLALAAGDGPLAEWAAEIGLLVVPYQEGMYRLRMQARDLSGDPDGVRQAFTEAQRAAQSFDPLEDVLPETRELYERLLRTRRQADAGNEPELPTQT